MFTYRRDNRTKDPKSDVLSEAGNTLPEQVTLDLPWGSQPVKGVPIKIEEVPELLVRS